MNIIARHTFKCTGKNPVQSAIIIVSVIIITACILVALSVSPVFRATASTWAGASFAGSDAIISFNSTSDDALLNCIEADDTVENYFAAFLTGTALLTRTATLNGTIYITDDKDKTVTLNGSELVSSSPCPSGEIPAYVSQTFAERAGIEAGDSVYIKNVDISVTVEKIFNSGGLFYSGYSNYIVLDFADMPTGTVRQFNTVFVYMNNPCGENGPGAAELDKLCTELEGLHYPGFNVVKEDGKSLNYIKNSVEGSMRLLAVAVAVIIILMSFLLYFSYSVIVKNRTEHTVRFKSAGATPFQCVAILFAEVAVYAVAGGITGLILGRIVMEIMEKAVASTVTDATGQIAFANYAYAFLIAVGVCFASCFKPAADISFKSVRRLTAGEARLTRHVPFPLAALATLAFAAAFAFLFAAENGHTAAATVIFIIVAVIWVLTIAPFLLKGVASLSGALFHSREPAIGAMGLYSNAGISASFTMLLLLILFAFTGNGLLGIVDITMQDTYSRFDSDYIVISSSNDTEQGYSALQGYLAADGVTDGCLFKKTYFNYLYKSDGTELPETVTSYAVSEGKDLKYFSLNCTDSMVEEFDGVRHPIMITYFMSREYGINQGDTVVLKDATGNPSPELTVAAIDTTVTAWDYTVVFLIDDLKTNGSPVQAANSFWLNGEADFDLLRLAVDGDGEILFKTDDYYPLPTANDDLRGLLAVFTGFVYLLTALALANLITVTAFQRKHEFGVLALAGMTPAGQVLAVAFEAAELALPGFVAGALLSFGLNRATPVMAELVGRYVVTEGFNPQTITIPALCSVLFAAVWLTANAFASKKAERGGLVHNRFSGD